MSLSDTARSLLSALRKSGSRTALEEVPEAYFTPDELPTFQWLKDYVRQYRAFPNPVTFRRETGEATVITQEPLPYYLNRARQRALYSLLTPIYSSFREAMTDRKPDDAVRLFEEGVALARQIDGGKKGGLMSLKQAVQLTMDDYEEAHMTPGLRGITTGWPYFDDITDGHQNGDVNTFVARPGRGKTQLLLKQAHGSWKAGHKVLFVSNELGGIQLTRRILGIDAQINPKFFRKGELTTRCRVPLDASLHAIDESNVPFDIVVGSFRKSVPAIRALAEELMPDIIYVDASYLLTPEKKRGGSGGRREVVSDVIEELKMVALDLNRPVVQSVQFNRQAKKPIRKEAEEADDDKNPLSHLSLETIGETDVIGQVSSLVVGIDLGKEPHESDRRLMGFLKGRDGETGWWEVNYDFHRMNFDIITPRIGHNGGPPIEDEPLENANMDWMV